MQSEAGAGETITGLRRMRVDDRQRTSMSDDETRPRRVSVRKFGAGKSSARMTGPAEYAAAAEEALSRSFTTRAVVLADQFRELMRKKGVPDDVIDGFLRSVAIDDESYLTERRE
jgi:hypothetical protein